MSEMKPKGLKEKAKILHEDIAFLLKSYQKYRTGIMICIEGESAELLGDIQGLAKQLQNQRDEYKKIVGTGKADSMMALSDVIKLLEWAIGLLGVSDDLLEKAQPKHPLNTCPKCGKFNYACDCKKPQPKTEEK